MPNYRRALNRNRTYFLTVDLLQRRGNNLLVAHIEQLRHGAETLPKREIKHSALGINATIRRNALRLLRPTGIGIFHQSLDFDRRSVFAPQACKYRIHTEPQRH